MTTKNEFKQYRRKGLSEMRQVVPAESLEGISISEVDMQLLKEFPNIFMQGYVARNPKDYKDQWYVAKKYFDDNIEPITPQSGEGRSIEDVAAELFPLDDPKKNMFHDNMTQYRLRDAFCEGFKFAQSSSPQIQAYVTYEDLAITASEMEWPDEITDMIKKLVRHPPTPVTGLHDLKKWVDDKYPSSIG